MISADSISGADASRRRCIECAEPSRVPSVNGESMRSAHARRSSIQIACPWRSRGGARRGAGRKPSGDKAGVPHVRRPECVTRILGAGRRDCSRSTTRRSRARFGTSRAGSAVTVTTASLAFSRSHRTARGHRLIIFGGRPTGNDQSMAIFRSRRTIRGCRLPFLVHGERSVAAGCLSSFTMNNPWLPAAISRPR
jgi:hypothetical protein